MLSRRWIYCAVGLALLHGHDSALAAVDADKLVAEAEKIRSPSGSYRTKVVVTDMLAGKPSDLRTYESYANGEEAGLVKFITPASDLGKKLLIRDDNMWIYIPTSANPIRISPRQKLTGNAAYGDIASISYVRNYEARFIRKDKFNDAAAYVLDLMARPGKLVTYDKIEYWIDAQTHRPLQAHFMTKSGKILRACGYSDYAEIQGRQRPTKLTIVNHLDKGHQTTIAYSDFKEMKFPALMFKKESLGRD